MPEFVCRLGAPDGSVVEQRRVAASPDALRRELEGEGFHVFSLAAALLLDGYRDLNWRKLTDDRPH